MDSNEDKSRRKESAKSDKAASDSVYAVSDDKLQPGLREVPVFSTADFVLFPGIAVIVPVRDAAQEQAVQRAMKERQEILVAYREAEMLAEPKDDKAKRLEHAEVGTLARIMKLNKLPEGKFQVTLRGVSRLGIDDIEADETYRVQRAQTSALREKPLAIMGEEVYRDQALLRSMRQIARQFFEHHPPQGGQDLIRIIENTSTSPGMLADLLANQIDMPVRDRLRILLALSLSERIEIMTDLLVEQVQVERLIAEISQKVRNDMDKQQREYFLRQQIRAIREQLGETNDPSTDLDELREKVQVLDAGEEVRTFCMKQLRRLSQMQPSSAEYGVARTHLEVLLDIPWKKFSEDHLNIAEARRILDADHYDLQDVKERILEHLAVLALKKDLKAPILCLYGPPGVGKTSLGKSVARALGRQFYRISLGGVHDESEIRGHRRTYVASMPGRIVQALRRVQTMNPVLMLDEIDKIGSDMRGDPSNALLEVLDPEQNFAFSDNYVEVPVDLSQVLFMTTANNLETIPAPLRDRMEIIEISGYTHYDKREIATKFLIPKLLAAHGLLKSHLTLTPEALDMIISNHTREAGVRQLEQRLAKICRKVATRVAEARSEGKRRVRVTVTPRNLEDFVGKRRYEFEVADRVAVPGVATGLAWTPAGGDILFIEAGSMSGRGELVITGKLGDVMQESVKTALTLIRTKADKLGLKEDAWAQKDLHIHVPAGAIPKDGPSAGVAIFCAMLSLFKHTPIVSTLAMTGEISLRGHVLAVGGIKEKVLGAHRAGIKTVILPARNQRDLDEIDATVRRDMTFHCVSTIDEVIAIVFGA
ncbi:MAG: endopeptidase La [Proteobacteria bacterium]|nr:endopeptidase La [Pseudomonadota bacterium]